MPFVSTRTEYWSANQYMPDTFTNHSFIGEIEFDTSLTKLNEEKAIELVNNLIKHAHIDSVGVNGFKSHLLENLNNKLIMLKSIDVQYETIQTYHVGEKFVDYVTNEGSKKTPKTYEEEIDLLYAILTKTVNANISTEAKVEIIEKLTRKPITTKNPKPPAPNGPAN